MATLNSYGYGYGYGYGSGEEVDCYKTFWQEVEFEKLDWNIEEWEWEEEKKEAEDILKGLIDLIVEEFEEYEELEREVEEWEYEEDEYKELEEVDWEIDDFWGIRQMKKVAEIILAMMEKELFEEIEAMEITDEMLYGDSLWDVNKYRRVRRQ